MPLYTETADIYNVVSEKVVAELTDDAAGESVDTDIIDSALERAESVVDSYVGKVYTVPLTVPVDANITHAVLTLARCYLYSRRPKATPDNVKDACTEIVEWLEMVADGTIELPDAPAATDSADSGLDDEIFTTQVF